MHQNQHRMKKWFFPLLLMLSAGVIANAQPKPENISITVKQGILNVNKVPLSKDWDVKKLIGVLGNLSRERSGYNRTYSYDSYGIVIFEKSPNKEPSGIVSELQVYFSEPKEKGEVATKGYFAGNYSIDGVTISRNTELNDLRVKLNDYEESESYTEHSYRFAKNGLYFYFQFNSTDDRLIKVSVGKDKEKKD